MLDFGWAELFLIMAVGVLVIGPAEIPSLMRGLGRLMRRIQYMKHAISSQFDAFMHDDDIDDIRNAVNFEVMRGGKRPDGHEDFDEAAEDAGDDMVPLSKKAAMQAEGEDE